MNLADRWHSAILKNSLDLMRYDAHLRTEILALLKGLVRDLVADLTGAGLDTPRTDWQRARLRSLLAAVDERIGDAYGQVADAHAAGLAEAVDASSLNLVAALNEAAGVDLLHGIRWMPQQLKSLVDGSLIDGAPSRDWWERQAGGLAQSFADQMRHGMVRGESIGSLTARVRDLMDISGRKAEALVRTSAMAANNAAHLATWQENADVLESLQWTATLDPDTCLRCGALDGQTWALDAKHETAPLHWNCRCVLVPITKTWEQLATKNKALARKLDESMPTGMRSSMGGRVSADTTWRSWLEGQPRKVQEEALGPARLKLWDAGKLTIQDLVDQRGNVLTLDELKARA